MIKDHLGLSDCRQIGIEYRIQFHQEITILNAICMMLVWKTHYERRGLNIGVCDWAVKECKYLINTVTVTEYCTIHFLINIKH